jgi:hypothetical protein
MAAKPSLFAGQIGVEGRLNSFRSVKPFRFIEGVKETRYDGSPMSAEPTANSRGPVRRQHFVPRHYLRQFGYSDTEQISLARIEPYHYVPKATIARQCQEDYFYDDDGKLEDLLKLGEDDMAPVLVDVCRKMAYSDRELGLLRMLAVLLHVRTRKAAEAAKVFPRRMFAEVTQAGIDSGELPPPPEDWNPEAVDFSGVSAMLIGNAIPCWLEMSTLDCKLLHAPATSAFVTSDNPALLLNQFADGAHPLRRFVGFAQSGFQLLLPLSPRVCLYFYDRRVFKVGKGNGQVVEIGDSDTNTINTLELQSADVCLYFNDTVPENRARGLIEKYKTLRKPIQDSLRTLPGRTANEQFLHLQSPPLTLPRPWTFSHVQNADVVRPGTRRDPIWTAAIWKVVDEIEAGHPPQDFFNRMEQILVAEEMSSRADV